MAMARAPILYIHPLAITLALTWTFSSLLDAAQVQDSATMDPNPPLISFYKQLSHTQPSTNHDLGSVVECELPIIDLSLITGTSAKLAETCKAEIAAASSEWGFFQVKNHGIPSDLLERIRSEQLNLFHRPFEKKSKERMLHFPADCYRCGIETATSLQTLSWSEAYHVPLGPSQETLKDNTRKTIEELAACLSKLAQLLAGVLAEALGRDGEYFEETCTSETCYLRLNRYPPCPIPGGLFGLIPHTDSDFLTVLCQDQVGGLQLMKDGRWITVKPNPAALVVNIGDLFQAWSNGVYKSVEHRVVANPHQERLSAAYFLCPSCDTIIQTQADAAIYRSFSFGEFRKQVREDVKLMGCKVGLPRFLTSS